MGVKFTVKLSGVKRTTLNLSKYSKYLESEVGEIMMRGALNVERAAKEMITEKEAVDTGRLRASISVNWSGSGMSHGRVGAQAKGGDGVGQPKGRKRETFVVGTRVDYGPYVEQGTKKMAARPYLYPALFMYENEVLKDLKKALMKKVVFK